MWRKTALCLALAVATLTSASTAQERKDVQNSKGTVSYQLPSGPARAIAPQATVALQDRDTAMTGDASLATVTLPDSSQVLVGSNSKVQLAFFNRTDIANAKFVIYQGRFRFTVRHPAGAKANYTFQTPTAQIAVRGTEGDIGVGDDGSLTVNVYQLGDPNLPVEVTQNGATYAVAAGQSFVSQLVNGVVQDQVTRITDQVEGPFASDFGLPSNWQDLKNGAIQAVKRKIPCPRFVPC